MAALMTAMISSLSEGLASLIILFISDAQLGDSTFRHSSLKPHCNNFLRRKGLEYHHAFSFIFI